MSESIKHKKQALGLSQLIKYAKDSLIVVGVFLISAVATVICDAILVAMVRALEWINGYKFPDIYTAFGLWTSTITLFSLIFFGFWMHVKGLIFMSADEDDDGLEDYEDDEYEELQIPGLEDQNTQ